MLDLTTNVASCVMLAAQPGRYCCVHFAVMRGMRGLDAHADHSAANPSNDLPYAVFCRARHAYAAAHA